MTIEFWTLGKNSKKEHQELIKKYLQLVNRYYKTEMVFIEKAAKIKSNNPSVIKESEAKLVLDRLDNKSYNRAHLILLDENGKTMSSREFSHDLQNYFNYLGNSKLIFLAGGAFGFHSSIIKSSKSSISLSKMTFPHDLVRVLFLEQLYRAFSIIANEKYHND